MSRCVESSTIAEASRHLLDGGGSARLWRRGRRIQWHPLCAGLDSSVVGYMSWRESLERGSHRSAARERGRGDGREWRGVVYRVPGPSRSASSGSFVVRHRGWNSYRCKPVTRYISMQTAPNWLVCLLYRILSSRAGKIECFLHE